MYFMVQDEGNAGPNASPAKLISWENEMLGDTRHQSRFSSRSPN